MFFKVCKGYLKLGKECRSLFFDAMTARAAIVFASYMMLALERRQNVDARGLGELFFLICDEIADITVKESLMIIMETVLKVFENRCVLT